MSNVTDLASQAHELLERQKSNWPLARDNFAALANVQTRVIEVDDISFRLQFNPGRLVSTSAKVDAKSIGERKCFLCPANRPSEQESLPFGDDYLVLINPFPIFPEHFTIPHRDHVPQRIAGSFEAMLDLARAMSPRYTVFYNGPKCGASAPDHLHFQAGDRGFMTIEGELDRIKGKPIVETDNLRLHAPPSIRPFVLIDSDDRSAAARAFDAMYQAFVGISPTGEEPMMNVLAWFDAGRFKTIIFPRAKHRPSFYFAEGDAKILLSPASVDLGGVCIMPVERDYHRLTADHLRQMLGEVMLPRTKVQTLATKLAGQIQ